MDTQQQGPAAVGKRIRGTHPYTFRSGEWATVRAVVQATVRVVVPFRAVVPGADRDCYLVEFPDGQTDYWPVVDPSEPYEFEAAS